MEEKTTTKEFNHSKAATSDMMAIIAELEHIRRHALRSASVAVTDDSESVMQFLIIAKQAQTIRRDYMKKHFGEINSKFWCLCKSAACLRQIAYEVCESDAEELREIDNLVDDIWGSALGKDLSDCEACITDKEDLSPE